MLTVVLINLCLVFCHALTTKPDFGPSQSSFVPSLWNEMITAASQQVGSVQNVPAPRLAEGRSYGSKRRGYGGGHKHQSFMTELDIDPTPIKLVCKVQEPLEHIIWVLSRCPGHGDYGSHPDRLIAEGATVTDKSNYDVRIIGANSTITSELLIKNPLSPSGSGVYRCEAWPHGGGGPPYGQYVAHDIFIIGAKDLLKACFGGWDASPPEHSGWSSFAAKSGGNGGNSKVRGDFKNQYPRFNYSSSASNKVEVKVHRDGYHDNDDYDEEKREEEEDAPALNSPPTRHSASGSYSSLQQQYNKRYRPQNFDRVYSHRQSNENNPTQLYQSATTTPKSVQLVFRPSSNADNQENMKYVSPSKQNENSRFEPASDSSENLSPETQSLIKEYYKYILNQQNQDSKNQENSRHVNSKFDSSKVATETPTTEASTVPARYYIVPTSTATPAFSKNPSPREPIYPFSSSRQSKAEATTESAEIWNVDNIMKKSPSVARIESRASKALYGWKHGENGTVEKMEENVTPEVVTVLPTKQENFTDVKSVDF